MRRLVGPIIWIIVLSFIFYGGTSFLLGTDKESLGVGRVFGKIVTFKEFRDAMRSVEVFMPQPDEAKWQYEDLENAAWQQVVLEREAAKEYIQVNDTEVRDEIKKLFGGDGAFNPEFYQQWVENNFKENARQFEERLRRFLAVQKLLDEHRKISTAFSEAEVDQAYANENTELNVEYASFDSEKEAADFHDAHAEISTWEKARDQTDSEINKLGPISVHTYMRILQIDQDAMSTLLAQSADQISSPIKTLSGFQLIRIISQENHAAEPLTGDERQAFQEKLATQASQSSFIDWWAALLKRASVEKFDLE